MNEHANSTPEERARYVEALVDAIGGVIWEYDWTAEVYSFMSAGVEELLGYPAEAWLAPMFWTRHVHPDDLVMARTSTDEATERLEEHDIEYRMIHADGSVVWVREIIKPHRDADGHIRQQGLMVDITAQKSAELAEQQAEAGFREMIETGGWIAMRIDFEGRFTYASSAFCELVGKTSDELVGLPSTDVLAPEERERIAEGHRRHMAGEPTPRSFQVHVLAACGERRLVELQNVTLYDASGRPCGATAMGQDITEREALGRELTRTAQEFDAVFRLLGDAYVRVDEGGIVRDFKGMPDAATLLTPAEAIGKHATEVFGERDTDLMRDAAIRAHDTGETATVEYRAGTRSGTRDFEARLLPVAEDSTAMIIRDVSQRIAREQEIAESRDFLERLLGLIDSGVLVINGADFTVTSANAPAEWIFGYASDELIGMDGTELDAGSQSAEELLSIMEEQIEATGSYHDEIELKRRDGTTFLAEASVRPIDAAATQFLAVIRDVTERTRAEQAIRESEQRFRSIVDSAPFGLHFYRLGERGNLLLTGSNAAADAMFGVEHGGAAGMSVDDSALMSAELTELFRACRAIAADGGTWQMEQALTWVGEPARTLAVTVFQTTPGAVGVAFVDVTERKRTEERERQYQQRLSALSAELIGAEERERRRLAQELHDRVSQSLAVARMHLGAALDRAPEVIEEAADSLPLLDDAIRESRAITTELSPPVLYELGLVPGLAWLAEQYRRAHGLEVVLSLSERVEVGEGLAAFFFRTARELLMNVVKYAETDTAWLSLDTAGNDVVLTVADQGLGFDTESLSAEGVEMGFGLFSVGENARRFGGTLEIDSRPGAGTRVTVEVPR